MSIEQTATTRRVTRPRLLITQVLAELSRFATAQEITDILRARHAHRHGHRLPQCADDGLPRRARRNPRQRRGLYRECSDQHHHHHIVCHECGRTIEIEIPGLEVPDHRPRTGDFRPVPQVCGEACHRTASQRRHLTKGWTTDDARRYWPSALEQIMAQSRRYWPSASVPFQSLAQ